MKTRVVKRPAPVAPAPFLAWAGAVAIAIAAVSFVAALATGDARWLIATLISYAFIANA